MAFIVQFENILTEKDVTVGLSDCLDKLHCRVHHFF